MTIPSFISSADPLNFCGNAFKTDFKDFGEISFNVFCLTTFDTEIFCSEIHGPCMDSPKLTFNFCSFERELKNKLSEKTRGAQSEEQVLLKAFKYFDLNDNGVVEPDEFAKAIEKIGIQIPTRQVSLALNHTFHIKN